MPKSTEPLYVELFVPSRIDNHGKLTAEWSKERGMHYWRFANPHSNHPHGIRYTEWEQIVWSYRMYFGL